MKLLTHNMLACHIKTVKNGFPFKIEATKVEEIEADFDPDFLRHIFPRIEYKALREAAETLGAASFSEQFCPLAVHLFRLATRLYYFANSGSST